MPTNIHQTNKNQISIKLSNVIHLITMCIQLGKFVAKAVINNEEQWTSKLIKIVNGIYLLDSEDSGFNNVYNSNSLTYVCNYSFICIKSKA